MLCVYNETRYPWTLEKSRRTDSLVQYRYVRVSKTRGKTRALYVISHANIVDVNETKEMILELLETKQPVQISDQRLGITFNRRGFRPVIRLGEEGNHNVRHILLSTLFLKGSIVVNSTANKNAFVLDYQIKSGALSFVASFVEGGVLTMTTFDVKTKQIHTRTFTCEQDGSITVKNTSWASKSDLPTNSNYKIRKFRPRRATYAVIARAEDRELAEAIVNPQHHQLFIIDDVGESLYKTMEDLLHQRYQALTVFVNNEDPNYVKGNDLVSKYVRERVYFVRELYPDGNISTLQ
jgi:hypothetical protein